MATEVYDETFYDIARAGARASADAVVPIFLEHYRPETVVDVGCGGGWWGSAFQHEGCHVLGVDGEWAGVAKSENPFMPLTEAGIKLRVHDLSEPGYFTDGPGWDLAVCLEVAEHLPAKRADGFIRELCETASVILFSAAIPGQGGAHHVNEQWPAYWVERFEANGFTCSGALRWEVWNDERVENWYRQNLIVAAKEPGKLPGLFDTPLAPVWPVVHPVLFDARRA